MVVSSCFYHFHPYLVEMESTFVHIFIICLRNRVGFNKTPTKRRNYFPQICLPVSWDFQLFLEHLNWPTRPGVILNLLRQRRKVVFFHLGCGILSTRRFRIFDKKSSVHFKLYTCIYYMYIVYVLYTYIHACMHTYIQYILACRLTYIHTYIHSFIHTYIHTYLLTYLHTYILKYLHTYIFTYLHT